MFASTRISVIRRLDVCLRNSKPCVRIKIRHYSQYPSLLNVLNLEGVPRYYQHNAEAGTAHHVSSEWKPSQAAYAPRRFSMLQFVLGCHDRSRMQQLISRDRRGERFGGNSLACRQVASVTARPCPGPCAVSNTAGWHFLQANRELIRKWSVMKQQGCDLYQGWTSSLSRWLRWRLSWELPISTPSSQLH